MRVADCMSRKLTWIHPSMPVLEAARRMSELGIGCLPVGEGGQLLGMITDRDIVSRSVVKCLHPNRTHVRDVMTTGAVWCSEDQTALEAAEIIRSRGLRRLPVLDGEKTVVGLISLDDLCGMIPDNVVVTALQAIIGARGASASESA